MNIRDEDEGDGSNQIGVCYERGVCDEDQDGVPSYHGSTSSLYNYDQSVKRKGFDTPIDPITRKKKSFVCMEQHSKLKHLKKKILKLYFKVIKKININF